MKAGEICSKSASLLGGDRRQTHGDAKKNHENIAHLWNAYLHIRRVGGDLTAQDVATMMALLKVARMESGRFNEDDAVDGAAYLAIRGEIDAG